MVETPTRRSRSSRRQSPLENSDLDNESSAAENTLRARPIRRRTGKFIEDLSEDDNDKEAMAATNRHANGNANGHTNGYTNGNTNGVASATGLSAPVKVANTTVIPNADPKEDHVVDGWRPGQDPKVDYSGEFEFGGSLVTLAMMILFPVLMWYMWVGATYYNGKFPSRSPGQSWSDFGAHLVDLVYTGAYPHAYAWAWYWGYFIFEGALYCILPGVWGKGKPLPHAGGKQLPYFCNAYASLYTTLAVLAGLHFSGVWPLYNAIDHFGPLLSVAIFTGFIVSFIAYFSAIWRGKQHRMTGYPIYDFFMGAELNPRMFGILDFKMFFEVRMPWYILLILSLGAAARQHEQYGYVSGEVWFLVMAHFLYANACAKGEELIITTW
jgi:delta24(24(1))-sterol reductase